MVRVRKFGDNLMVALKIADERIVKSQISKSIFSQMFSFCLSLTFFHLGRIFDWENVKTLKIDERGLERKVRKALEIQLKVTSPHSENGLNQDDGQ